METLRLEDATEAQVRAYATDTLNLDVPDSATRAQIVALMQKAGFDGETITVAASAPTPQARRARPAAAKAAALDGRIDPASLEQKFVSVLIPESEGEPEMEFVSVNGAGIYIKRGTPQRIRWPYFVALSNAKKIVYTATERDGLGAAREVPLIPTTVIGGDPEVLAYLAQKQG